MPAPVHSFLTVSLEAWLTIVAILTGPIAALWIQKWLDDRRTRRNRKIAIFHTLMANRATRLSQPWVLALNGIETEFYGETKVIEAWRVVVDHLYSQEVNDPKKYDQWQATLSEQINDMLYEMAELLGYHFDKVTLKRNVYNPQLWVDIEQENHAVRRKFLELLDGKRRLPVAIFEDKFPDLNDEPKK